MTSSALGIIFSSNGPPAGRFTLSSRPPTAPVSACEARADGCLWSDPSAQRAKSGWPAQRGIGHHLQIDRRLIPKIDQLVGNGGASYTR